MLFLDTILDTLAENLALDEALLLQAEDGGPEVFRLWEAGDERRRAEPREGPNGARIRPLTVLGSPPRIPSS